MAFMPDYEVTIGGVSVNPIDFNFSKPTRQINNIPTAEITIDNQLGRYNNTIALGQDVEITRNDVLMFKGIVTNVSNELNQNSEELKLKVMNKWYRKLLNSLCDAYDFQETVTDYGVTIDPWTFNVFSPKDEVLDGIAEFGGEPPAVDGFRPDQIAEHIAGLKLLVMHGFETRDALLPSSMASDLTSRSITDDLSGNGRDFTVVGSLSTTTSDDGKWGGGITGFTDTNYMARTGISLDLDDCSFFIRFYFGGSDGSNQMLFSAESGNEQNFLLYFNTNNLIISYHDGTSFQGSTIASGVTVGYHTVYFRRVGTTYYWNIDDGASTGSFVATGVATNLVDKLLVGVEEWTSREAAVNCDIHEIRLWDSDVGTTVLDKLADPNDNTYTMVAEGTEYIFLPFESGITGEGLTTDNERLRLGSLGEDATGTIYTTTGTCESIPFYNGDPNIDPMGDIESVDVTIWGEDYTKLYQALDDHTGNGHTLTAFESPSIVTGSASFGGGYDLASNSYFTVGNPIPLKPSGTAHAYFVRVKHNTGSIAVNEYVCNFWKSGSNGTYFSVGAILAAAANNYWEAFVGSGGTSYSVVQPAVSVGTSETTLIAIFDEATDEVILRINGTEYSASWTGAFQDADTFTIGDYAVDTNQHEFNGHIYDFRHVQGRPTAQEISDYEDGTIGSDELIGTEDAAWFFEEGSTEIQAGDVTIEVCRNGGTTGAVSGRDFKSVSLTKTTETIQTSPLVTRDKWVGSIGANDWGATATGNSLAYKLTLTGDGAGTPWIDQIKLIANTESDVGITRGTFESYFGPGSLDGGDLYIGELVGLTRLEALAEVQGATVKVYDPNSPVEDDRFSTFWDLWIDEFGVMNFKKNRGTELSGEFSFDERSYTALTKDTNVDELWWKVVAYGPGSGAIRTRIVSADEYANGGLTIQNVKDTYGDAAKIGIFEDKAAKTLRQLYLRARAELKLRSTPKTTYKLPNGIISDYNVPYEVGDVIHLVDELSGVDEKIAINSLDFRVNSRQGEDISVELGEPVTSLADILKTLNDEGLAQSRQDQSVVKRFNTAAEAITIDDVNYSVFTFTLPDTANIKSVFLNMHTDKNSSGDYPFNVQVWVDPANDPPTTADNAKALPELYGSPGARVNIGEVEITNLLDKSANNNITPGVHTVVFKSAGGNGTDNGHGVFKVHLDYTQKEV